MSEVLNKAYKRETFVTLFPETDNSHLTKDVGMIAYVMGKHYNYDSKIVAYNNGSYPYLEKELLGFNIEFIERVKGDPEVDGMYYLIDNAEKIDVLHLFHLNDRSLNWIKLFKKLNPQGKVYLKLDANMYITYEEFSDSKIDILKKCSLITVETKYLYDFLKRVLEVKVEYIPNGFYDFFESQTVQYEEKENFIITVGRIGLYLKANEILMEAFKLAEDKIKDWKLKIIGPILNTFNPYIDQFFLDNPNLKDRIIFTGEIVSKKELEEEYRKAKIFCLTSRSESFGIVYVEAAKNGCFLLSSNVLPALDVTDNKKYGDIFGVDKIEELSKLIVKYTQDEERLKNNCEEIQKFAYSNFNWIDICNKIYNYINDKNYSIINENCTNKEFKEVRRIIESGASKNNINDRGFIDRLKYNPEALKMSFWENHFELSSFDKYPEISGKILDFGCGSGNLDIYLARKGMFIHGIDLSEIGINIANYYKHKEVDEVKKRLCFTLNDITKDVPKDLYDSAWSTNVFEHILYPGPIFEGLRKWIKPGGYILISVPLGYAYNDSNHVHHFMNNDELKVHLEKYIDVIKVDSDLSNKVIRALCRF